ncbi:MAG: type II toxin-antitoxin system Phd/YefM family antitoxin [Acidobacteria bacterium]|nr:type II toxin-antitoxin system Phd/YefM family antitoxin [Acidobacteriota bacterium]
MLIEVNVDEAQKNLSRLLAQAIAGEEVIITQPGQPVVKLTPVASVPFQRKLGTAKGDFIVPSDFDAPLPDHVLAEFEK